MSNAKQNQNWIRGTRGRTATAALASAILFVLAGFAAGSAQAQTFTTLVDFAAAPMALTLSMVIRLSSAAETVTE